MLKNTNQPHTVPHAARPQIHACHSPLHPTPAATATSSSPPFSRLSVAAAASAHPSPSSSSPLPPSGIFVRDVDKSDMASYDRMLSLLELGKLQRLTAVQLIEGVEIECNGDWATLRFLTVVPFFQIDEKYSLKNVVSIPRRDLRGGGQEAVAKVDAEGVLKMRSTWGAPNAGRLDEELKLVDGGSVLEYTSTLKVAAGAETTRQIYCKVDSWKPKYQWDAFKALRLMASGGRQY